MSKVPPIDPAFVRGLIAYLHYWQRRTAALDDDAIGTLDPDFPNLLHAVEMGLAPVESRVLAGRVLQQCFFWVERGGYLAQWRPLLERALARLPDDEPTLRFRLSLQLGQIFRLLHQREHALETLHAALALARDQGTTRPLAESYLNLAQIHFERGELQQAEQSATLAQAHLPADAPRLEMIVWQTLGRIALARGQHGQAEQWLRQALRLRSPDISPIDEAHNRHALASALQSTQPHEAADLYQQSIDQLGALSNPAPLLDALLNLGALHFAQRQFAEAERLFRRGERLLHSRAGWPFHRALACNNLGCVLIEQGFMEEAEAYLRQAIVLYQQIEDFLNLANAYGNLAELLLLQGRLAEAVPALQRTLTLLDAFPEHRKAGEWRQRYRAQLASLGAPSGGTLEEH